MLASLMRALLAEHRAEATAIANERIYRYALERAARMQTYTAHWQRRWDRQAAARRARDRASGSAVVRTFRSGSA